MMEARLDQSIIGSVGGDILSRNQVSIGSIHIHQREGEYRPASSGAMREGAVHDRDFRFLDSVTRSSELVVGDSYRIHIAEYQGKVTAVKVYEGPDAKEQIEADIALNNRIRHHAIVRYIHSRPTASPPFAVFDSVVQGSESRDRASTDLNSLPCYLAGALRRGEKDSLVAGARLMRDVAYGLDHISKFFPLAGIALDLFVKKDKICISLSVGELDQVHDGTDGHLVIYHKICDEAFREANRECHFDKRKIVNNSEDSEAKFDSDSNSDSDSESPLGHIKVVEDESEPTLPRREYAFVPVDNLSLRKISADCSRFINQLDVPMSGVQYLHYLRRNSRRATPVRHRCLGYLRQEVTLSTSVSDSAIILHRTPSLQEVCQLCGQLVEAGYFKCSCGEADDGVSPTIQCGRCSMWGHRHCQSNTMCLSCSGILPAANQLASSTASHMSASMQSSTPGPNILQSPTPAVSLVPPKPRRLSHPSPPKMDRSVYDKKQEVHERWIPPTADKNDKFYSSVPMPSKYASGLSRTPSTTARYWGQSLKSSTASHMSASMQSSTPGPNILQSPTPAVPFIPPKPRRLSHPSPPNVYRSVSEEKQEVHERWIPPTADKNDKFYSSVPMPSKYAAGLSQRPSTTTRYWGQLLTSSTASNTSAPMRSSTPARNILQSQTPAVPFVPPKTHRLPQGPSPPKVYRSVSEEKQEIHERWIPPVTDKNDKSYSSAPIPSKYASGLSRTPSTTTRYWGARSPSPAS
ncbi:hypothetical protein C8J56DRAFT_1172309 [Mycena floridula]|nr:hypothetical protein C8J56DRAFT_1172309 [Mycena floridula]